ncbi:hypothetical protein J2Y45_000395 [Dyadobacter sp. BE34]|uniref:Immunity protein 50 n=1 Tax=Dyadobacter fermentans TaxID=94254 RepID=A0ABU1QS38_9BACT|nr:MULTISPECIES: Imm50 family immunity protein [Dyadobacter]MDR6803125.1 hypothetical protein [Dyadobacter fermentans]MDR7040867.1 hypothetical protein [Dyadobacter sp. BE242]MDR7195269.1 hypothetical protein [Dyadobacter sp. BE34]MDR7214185.1 hypothetical protein [Dyadobacter sp. BE31]MDR7260677.1 hypothetical protein [Dyadobacter sp. BE32]
MWLSLIEKSEAIRAIYRDSIPPLENVTLHEIKITVGEDTIITIKIDITTLPGELPKKWQANEINTVQLTFDLIKARIEKFDLNSPVSMVTRICILEDSGSKRMTLTSSSNAEVLVIRSSWIYLQSISAYRNAYKAGSEYN